MAEPIRKDSEPSKDTVAPDSTRVSGKAINGISATPSSDDGGNRRSAPRKGRIAAGLLFVLVLAWIVYRILSPQNLANLKFTPWGSDAAAKALVQRMLRVNKPWLEPAAVSATYSLQTSSINYSFAHGCRRQHSTLGPFSIVPGCTPGLRIGSIFQTPLHAMVGGSTNYAVKLLGRTKWRGRNVVAVDVAFASPIRCYMGIGGRADRPYSNSSYDPKTVRMLIDAAKAVPLLLLTSSSSKLSNIPIDETVSEFVPRFFELNGGLAPRALQIHMEAAV